MTTPIFSKVAIIGIGLIGSSLARAIHKHGLAGEIVCADQNPDYCAKAEELKLVSHAYTNAAEAVADADLTILCVPIGANASVAASIGTALKPGSILSDVGSVKQSVIRDVGPHVPAGVHFIPGHPIAGTEHSGPEAGFAELFKGRWAILTPMPDADTEALARMQEFWTRCESKVEVMEPRRHDRILAITSHLPHLIAYTIVGTATDLEEDLHSEVIKFSAGGFRDFTRIAASDPTMWRDIFINNQEAVLEIAQRFTEDVTGLQKAIRKGDGKTLFDLFTRTRAARRSVIQEKQA